MLSPFPPPLQLGSIDTNRYRGGSSLRFPIFFSMSISMSGQFSIANSREPPRSFVARRWPGAGAAPEFPCLRNRVQSFVYSMAILRSTQNTAVSLRSIILPCTADSSSVLFPPLPALAFLSFGSGDLRAGSVTSGLLCSSLS